MDVTVRKVTEDDSQTLVDFLVSNTFPFHVAASLDADSARERVEGGRFWGETSQGYWVVDGSVVVGLAVLEELGDDTPMFDLRIANDLRGRGYGREALRALTAEVFSSMPEVNRFEGQTRADNRAMQRVFLDCGFVKEAHYRESWPSSDGRIFASVAYAILRRDWVSGETTPVDWDALP